MCSGGRQRNLPKPRRTLRDKPRTRTAGRPLRWWSRASATIRSRGRIWRNAWCGRFGPARRSTPPESKPVTAEAVLRAMLAEKAMSLEGRTLGYLKDESIHPGLEQFEQQLLARMLLEPEFRDRVTAEPAEVDQAMKANPKWTREQATAMVAAGRGEPAVRILLQGAGGQVPPEEGSRATSRRRRRSMSGCCTSPRSSAGQGEFWITNSQVSNELSEQEKKLVLATLRRRAVHAEGLVPDGVQHRAAAAAAGSEHARRGRDSCWIAPCGFRCSSPRPRPAGTTRTRSCAARSGGSKTSSCSTRSRRRRSRAYPSRRRTRSRRISRRTRSGSPSRPR